MAPRCWKPCPNCVRRHRALLEKLQKEVEMSYAIVEGVDFIAGMRRVELAKANTPEDTLAEYWEMGMGMNFQFTLSYRCYCNACGFEFKTSHYSTAPLPEKDGTDP